MDKKDTNKMEHITPRQLRQILFYAEDALKIHELRAMLYEVKDQDKAYQVGHGMFQKMQADSEKQMA